LLIMLRSLSYGQSFQNALTSLVTAAPLLDVYYKTVEAYEAHPASGGDVPVDHVGELVLDGVDFAYTEGVPVLRDVTMRITPGEIVGIIGPSGAGKYTLVQLLLRLREPTAGAVLAERLNLRARWR